MGVDHYGRHEDGYVQFCMKQAHSLSRPVRPAADVVLSSTLPAPSNEAPSALGTAGPDSDRGQHA